MIGNSLSDIDKFEELFKLYYSDLCAYAMRYLGEHNNSEDLVSETFYVLWKSKDKLTQIENIKAYLFKSVHNNCLYYLRSKKNKPQIQEVDFSILEEPNSFVKDAMDSIIIKELLDQLEDLICDLPAQQQKVFRMKRFENKKNKEIAEDLNISVKTVEMHLSKATTFLKKELKEILPSFLLFLLFNF